MKDSNRKTQLKTFLSAIAITLIAISASFLFAACGNGQNDDALKETTVSVSFVSRLNDTKDEYTLNFNYKDIYFNNNANSFNKDIAMISYGAAVSTESKEKASRFFKDISFDNVLSSESFDEPTSIDSIAYTLAHKKIENYDVIAVTIRGFFYYLEWANNMLVGNNGNHLGFDQSADKVYTALKNYIESNRYKNIKLWICGYSRAGAVANVLSHKLLSAKKPVVNTANMFVYTFESPRALSKENAILYENVFNIVNSSDLITHVLPQEYELYRCGIDVDIYNENVEEYLPEFDSEIVLPKFKPHGAEDENEILFKNPKEYIKYLIELLLSEPNEKYSDFDISNRTKYVNNFEQTLIYVTKLICSLKPESIKNIGVGFKNLDTVGKINLIGDNGIYNFIKPHIESDGVTYNDNELNLYSENLRKFLLKDGGMLMATIMLYEDDLPYVIYMHLPEANYALLKNYQPQ